MYSKQVIIAESKDFTLTSFGNGDAYSLAKNGQEDESVFVQGDDATQFREEYDALFELDGNVSALAAMWWNYTP